jgi:hypothetical protein
MSGELQKYQALPISCMGDIERMGQLLASTNLFGTNNPADGFVIASMCHQQGISYMEYMQTYHFIKGKVSKRADAIQAAFQDLGGEIEILQRDEKGTVITLVFGKTKYTSKCVWEEIKGEPFASTQNYATPRKRMQMMWARAISDGVRTVCPKAVSGFYTPEEVETFDAEATVTPEVATKRAKKVQEQQSKPTAPAQPQVVQAQVSAPVYTQPQPTAQEMTAYNAEAEASRPVVVQQQAQPTAQEQEPTPFTIIEEQKNPDYSLCPIQGHLFRVKWETMPNEHLDAALTVAMPQGYLNYVQNLLTARKTTQQP